MPLCGEAHIKNVTTAGRPSQTNGMMIWDSDIKQLLASCGGVWNKSGCNYNTPPNIPSCWLVVAGGGVGGVWGDYGAGGGGAGGAICGTTDFSTATWYCVVIGAGGSSFGACGNNSCFAGTLATGGGNGGGPVPGFPFDQNAAGDGGSGGSPASRAPSNVGQGIAGQGNNGGFGYNAPVFQTPISYPFAGGGGGKGSVGDPGCVFSPFSNTNGCNGGGGCGIILDGILTMPVYAAGTRNKGTLEDCGVAGGGGGGSCESAVGRGFGRAGGGVAACPVAHLECGTCQEVLPVRQRFQHRHVGAKGRFGHLLQSLQQPDRRLRPPRNLCFGAGDRRSPWQHHPARG
mgnify:CR=1 FL=1